MSHLASGGFSTTEMPMIRVLTSLTTACWASSSLQVHHLIKPTELSECSQRIFISRQTSCDFNLRLSFTINAEQFLILSTSVFSGAMRRTSKVSESQCCLKRGRHMWADRCRMKMKVLIKHKALLIAHHSHVQSSLDAVFSSGGGRRGGERREGTGGHSKFTVSSPISYESMWPLLWRMFVQRHFSVICII